MSNKITSKVSNHYLDFMFEKSENRNQIEEEDLLGTIPKKDNFLYKDFAHKSL